MRFLKYPLGMVCLAVGLLALGAYFAYQLSHPAGWEGENPNAAIRFFQSSFFILAEKPVPLLILAGGGALLTVLGAFLIGATTALLFAASALCFGVIGGAALAERPQGTEPLLDLLQGTVAAVEKHPRDVGIIAGLGFSILLIVVFAAVWREIRSGKGKKPKSKAKAGSQAED